LTKLAEQVELQLRLLSLFPNTRKHAKVGVFGAQGDQPVAKKFLLVIYLKEDMLNTIVCTTAALVANVKHFFNRSHDAVIADACRCCFTDVYLFVFPL